MVWLAWSSWEVVGGSRTEKLLSWVEKMERRLRREDEVEWRVVVVVVGAVAGRGAFTTLNGERLGTSGGDDESIEWMLETEVRLECAEGAAEKTSDT